MSDALSELQPAAYEGIAFPVADVDIASGHDSAEHTARGRRGADIEPTGAKADRGRLVVPLYQDLDGWPADLFPRVWRLLVDTFKRTPIGELRHPLLGTFTAHVKDWRTKAAPDARSGVVLEVDWIEHNASVAAQLEGPDAPASESTVEALADDADAAMAAADPAATHKPTKPEVTSTLDALSSESRTYSDVVKRLDGLDDVVAGNLALAAFAGAEAHDAVAALEALRVALYALRERYIPRERDAASHVVEHDAPLWQVSLAVYGTVDGVATLLGANAIADPTLVPRGTVLVAPPLEG